VRQIVTRLIDLMPDGLRRALVNRFAPGPISTVDSMADFVQTRAAFIAQTSLFGYLKQRMGTSYMRYFEDDRFAASIRTAQIRVYCACAADLTVFATAVTAQQGGLKAAETQDLASHCYAYAMSNSGVDMGDVSAEAYARFRIRADRTLWPQAAIGESAFYESLTELIEAAPVIDEFKRLDEEIVQNSIRFRWRDIREQFRKRLDPAAICSDLRVKPDLKSGPEAAIRAPAAAERQDTETL
jgi:hypothetical protein